jgi:hypothetical protein
MPKNTELDSAHNLRVSTETKDDAISQLQAAFGDGRLNEQEFELRMTKAMDAQTRGDLEKLVYDLSPWSHPEIVPPKPRQSFAIFSGIEHQGRFTLPAHYEVSAIFGGMVIDLRQAQWEQSTCDIHIKAIFGGVQIFVPPGVRVVAEGTQVFGGISKDIRGRDLGSSSLTLRLHYLAVFGGIEIKTKE